MCKLDKFIQKRDIVKESADNSVSKLLYENIKEYAIEVAEDRALSSYKDGLKPSARRIIKALVDASAYSNKSTIKSAKIVGDTMGKYHPHGDMGIASALATLVNSNYPIVFGQGNWGSLTDGPASTRYTECKLSDFGMKFIECLNVADNVPNYSGEYMEPIDFPTRIPLYFLNESLGVAVGVAGKTPNHNLNEILDAFKYLIKNGEKATYKGMFKYFNGPDYKYGGKIVSTPEEVMQVYAEGKGTIKYECDYELITTEKNPVLVITGYCPGFYPDKFQLSMNEYIESGDLLYVNDNSTKNDPCHLEIVMKDISFFENKLHKAIRTSCSYQFYALDRVPSTDPTRDVETKILASDFMSLMKKWLDYRRDIERRMLEHDRVDLELQIYKLKCRMEAAKHLDVVKKCLEQEDSEKYLEENLSLLKRQKSCNDVIGSKYITNLKLNTIRKLAITEIQNEIDKTDESLKEIVKKLNNLDDVIVEQLNSLKKFNKPRKLKVK